jgi:hypothetical protein
MDSNSEDEISFYSADALRSRIAHRTARVTDEPRQLTMAAFRSSEALSLCTMARLDLISATEKIQISMRDKARRT